MCNLLLIALHIMQNYIVGVWCSVIKVAFCTKVQVTKLAIQIMYYHNCYVPENGTSLNNVGPSPCQRDNTPPCWMPFLITLIRSKGELKESFSNNKTRNRAVIWSFIASWAMYWLTQQLHKLLLMHYSPKHIESYFYVPVLKSLVDYSCMQGQDTQNKQTLWQSWFRVCSSGISYSEHNINLQTYKMVRYVQQKTAMSLLAKNMINMLNKHLQTQT